MVNVKKLYNIEIAGFDIEDYPDFCDAYVESASQNGVTLNKTQLDELNEQESAFINEYIILNLGVLI